MTRKALGRGLSALLQEVETRPSGTEEIDIELIDPNPLQPRRDFSDATLKELADSIRSSGIVQPVLLRRAEARYQLVAGERRWRAARLAGLKSIPAMVRDLNPIDVARAYEALQSKFNLTHDEIAGRLGANRSTVTNTLRLLRLHPEVQSMVASSALSPGHARALLSLDSGSAQLHLAEIIVKRGLSVRQVEAMVALGGPPKAASRAETKEKEIDPNTRAAVLEMERTLGTRVKLLGDEHRGRIEISYFSADDLNRIYMHITRQT
jgi:ParB family transcriptional regulator, chromosome partitioning protein